MPIYDKYYFHGDQTKTTTTIARRATVDLDPLEKVMIDPLNPLQVVPWVPGSKILGYVSRHPLGVKAGVIANISVDELIEDEDTASANNISLTMDANCDLQFTDALGVTTPIDMQKFFDNDNLPRIVNGVLNSTGATSRLLVLTRDDGSTITIDLGELEDDPSIKGYTSTVGPLAPHQIGTLTGGPSPIPVFESVTIMSSTTGTNPVTGASETVITYTNEDGTVFNVTVGETVTQYTNEAGPGTHQIGTYTNEVGNIQPVLETLTTLEVDATVSPNQFVYTREDGTEDRHDIATPCEFVTGTQAEINALRAAGSLKPCEIYIITNVSTLPGTVHVHAIDNDKIGANAWYYDPAVSAEGLACVYDLNSNRIESMYDHEKDVTVKSHEAVATFPWGNASITDFTNDHGVLNYTAGTITDVTIQSGGTLTMISGQLLRTTIKSRGRATIRNNGNYDNTFSEYCFFNQLAGTSYCRYSKFEGSPTVTQGGRVNFSNVRGYTSGLNTTGSVGIIANSTFDRALDGNIQNVGSLNIYDSHFNSYSQITVNGATRVDLRQSNGSSYGRFICSAGAQLFATRCNVSSYGYIQSIRGRLNATSWNCSGQGYVSHQSTGTNTVSNGSSNSQGNIRFTGTCTGNRIYYYNVSGGGRAYIDGSSTNCFLYYGESNSYGLTQANNSVNGRIYYNKTSSNGKIYSINNSTTHYIYYSEASSNGTLDQRNNSGSMRYFGVHVDSTAICRIQNSAVNGNIYYSSFHAYYYLLANFAAAATKTGLHGYGRRSYTVAANTLPNGTFVQNF